MDQENRGLLINLRVLYIEDEEFTRNELAMFLKRRVGQLVTAKDGKQGLEEFFRIKPDLVLTDLKLPEMSGIEFIEQIRARGSACPVIVISALSDTETIIKAVDLGIVKYVIKPLNTNELVAQMEQLALQILKSQQGNTILNGSRIITKEEKLESEKRIKSGFASFLKQCTGKGPRDIHVFIKGKELEIEAFEVLTLFELGLLPSRKNYGLVDYNRKIFYEENRKELEKRLGEELGAELSLEEVRNDAKANRDLLRFRID